MSNVQPQNIQVPSGLGHWIFIIRQSAVPAGTGLAPLIVKWTIERLPLAAGITTVGHSGDAGCRRRPRAAGFCRASTV
jgi:hypothetical protein